MNFQESACDQVYLLKQQFVPNFQHLDHMVQTQILTILELLVSAPDKKAIQNFSRHSLLQQTPLLRSLVWKCKLSNIQVLLQSLPLNPLTWPKIRKQHYETYQSLLDRFVGQLVDEKAINGKRDGFLNNLWNQIELDTRRTHSSLNFYQKTIDHSVVYAHRPTKNSDVLTRILYIWGRLNSSIGYVQGMNEILAPLYYLQFQKVTAQSQSQVFFLFSALIGTIIDMHTKALDETQQGIMGRINYLNKFLKVVELDLWKKLEDLHISPHYYSFRWLSLLLAQQFGLYQTMKLWDELFSYDEQKRFFFLYCCCIAILKIRKNQIMKGDFVTILPLIQKLRDINLLQVSNLAKKYFQKYSKLNINSLYNNLNKQIQQKKQEDSKNINKSWMQKSYKSIMEKTQNMLSIFKVKK